MHQRFGWALKCLGIRPDVKAAIAVSGGPDSVALALLASKWLLKGVQLNLSCMTGASKYPKDGPDDPDVPLRCRTSR